MDVTSQSSVTLSPNDSLTFEAAAWNYSPLAGGSLTSYPGEISVMLAGLPASGTFASIPGTSAVYTTGILLSGYLESLDGSIVIPLVDSDAARLGLPAGDLLLGSGYQSGGAYSGPTSVLTAAAAISSPEAAALFAGGEFELVFRDLSGNVTLGFPGSTLTSALSASMISPDGSRSVGALPLNASLRQTPEPRSIALLLLGLAIIVPRMLYKAHRP